MPARKLEGHEDPADALLSACDDGGVMTGQEALPDDHGDLFVLFAEALDPNSPVTVEQVEREWNG